MVNRTKKTEKDIHFCAERGSGFLNVEKMLSSFLRKALTTWCNKNSAGIF